MVAMAVVYVILLLRPNNSPKEKELGLALKKYYRPCSCHETEL